MKTICNIAIVEDDAADADKLKNCILSHGSSKDYTFKVDLFSSAESFVESYNSTYHCVFMDIEMSGINGMQAARLIRETDSAVLIVFVTNMTVYAIDGYSVNAYDFIVKPVNKGSFRLKFNRILNQISKNRNDNCITLSVKGRPRRVGIADITYVELFRHDLIFHLPSENIVKRGSMNAVEKELSPYYFSLCNSCYLVNLKYVTAIEGNIVTVMGDELVMSRGKIQRFIAEYAQYLGGTR